MTESITRDAAPSGVSSIWESVLDLPLAALTGFTALNGSWSADAGGFIKQTNTGAGYFGLAYDTEIYPGSGIIAQVDVRFPSPEAASTRRAMLGVSVDTALSGTSNPWVGLERTNGGVGQIQMQRGDQVTDTEATPVVLDTWYTQRVAVLGQVYTLSKDGTKLRARRMAVGDQVADRLVLVNYTGEVHYRNLKVWRLIEP